MKIVTFFIISFGNHQLFFTRKVGIITVDKVGETMKQRGFTLIELLITMALLSLLALMIYPTIEDYISNSKVKAYHTQIANIISSAKNWAADHPTELPDEGSTHTITLQDLIDGNYSEEVVDPTTKEVIAGATEIIISNDNGAFEYKVNLPEK